MIGAYDVSPRTSLMARHLISLALLGIKNIAGLGSTRRRPMPCDKSARAVRGR